MSDTSTRAVMAVPSPATSLSVGAFSETSGYNGVNIDTVKHVRFNAKGDASASDLVGQATGRVWLQSMRHVVTLSKLNTVVASRDRTHIVGNKGVSLLAGFVPPSVKPEDSAGSMPSAVDSYESSANTASGVTTAIDAGMVLVSSILRGVLSVASSTFSWTTGMAGVTANLTGAALNIANLGWAKDVDTPGVNLYSAGFMTVGSAKGTVSMVGVGGCLIASTYVTLAGAISTKVTGAFHTSMNAIGAVDLLAGNRVTIRGWLGVQVASRTAQLTARAAEVNLGSPFGFKKKPQINTLKLELNALESIVLESMVHTKIESLYAYETDAMDHEIEATIGMTMDVAQGVWSMKVEAAGTSLNGPTSQLKIDAAGVTLAGPGGASKVQLGPGKVDIVSGAGAVKIVPGVSLTVDGIKMDIK